jgi:two-component system, chemotaxis family, chemotaxis protein CheY
MSPTCKILLADDDPDIREVVSLVLEPHGFETVVAADGTEALELVKEHPDVELILADLMMPRLSGAELIGILKSDADLCRIPIVVLSGDNFAKETATKLGASDCLRKPVDLANLVATINRLVHR